MKTDYAPLDIASYLDNEEVIAEYLTAAAEDEDQNVLLAALAYVAKARGMARVAEAAGLGRESLYKTLAPGSHPRFETIRAILRALDVEIAVRAPVTDKSGEKSKATAEKREVMTEARRLVTEASEIAAAMASPRLAEEIIKSRALREELAKPESPAKRPSGKARRRQTKGISLGPDAK